jgi:hypothetical protein
MRFLVVDEVSVMRMALVIVAGVTGLDVITIVICGLVRNVFKAVSELQRVHHILIRERHA